MEKKLAKLFSQHNIDCFGFLPLNACVIKKQHLLSRVGISQGSIAIFAIPYYTSSCNGEKNISSYAIAKDYHLYFSQLSEQLLSSLRSEFPQNIFAVFADHSPIDERDAAAKAGLGIIGQHSLLITEKYSSYVFLGEIITDATLTCVPHKTFFCENCGACKTVCPFASGQIGQCLSGITQRKGILSEQEKCAIKQSGSVWGCDLCQEICPHTRKAKQQGTIYTSISFFKDEPIPLLTSSLLTQMDDTAFRSRAYSWRGREIILRNLSLTEQKNDFSTKNND